MTMIWTLRIRSRRLSSGERVGRAKVPVETLVTTERSAMSTMTAAGDASTSGHDGPPQDAGEGAAHCRSC